MAGMPGQVVAVRHGETVWSREGRHTGRTDVPLTDGGREQARHAGEVLRGHRFARVLASPLQRARETCALAGLAGREELCPALMEWDYGEYEGLTSEQIRALRPGWVLWRDGCPGGEMPADIAARADEVIAEVTPTVEAGEDVALFAHGHVLRVLAARWIEQEAAFGARLMLDTAAVSVLDAEHGVRALRRWNDPG
jgi:probable phosphoglycerate mutase